MIRVVINGRFACQPMTGVQRYALHTLLALDRLLSARPDVAAQLQVSVAVPDGAQLPTLDRMAVHRLPGNGRGAAGHAWEQWTLWRHARGGYLVNFNDSGPLLQTQQLVTIHDASVAAFPEAFGWRYRVAHHALVALLKRRVHTVMTVSEFARQDIERHFGVRAGLVGIEGWEHLRADAGSDGLDVLAAHGLQPGRYLLAAGSLKPNKNFALLDRALQLAPDLGLPVAIAGARDASIFRHSEAGANVRLLGAVSDIELAQLYRHAAWFVFPSLYEGFGLPLVEAMGNGCPVLAASAASIPEVCGDAALYFDPHDAAALAALLQRAVHEPGLRDTYRQRALARVTRFSWDANARILVDHLLLLAPLAPAARTVTAPVLRA
jgi:glycosyltransferase involved in cell wall biosynthesis